MTNSDGTRRTDTQLEALGDPDGDDMVDTKRLAGFDEAGVSIAGLGGDVVCTFGALRVGDVYRAGATASAEAASSEGRCRSGCVYGCAPCSIPRRHASRFRFTEPYWWC